MSPAEIAAADALITLALAEDLGEPADDVTSRVMIRPTETGRVNIVARQSGVLAGLPIAARVFARLCDLMGDAEQPTDCTGAAASVTMTVLLHDGAPLAPGTVVATLSGSLRSLLTGERTALNFLTHLSGIASLTRQYVDAVGGSPTVLLDTRKTHPGYRLLEKYAVRMGGGQNHRMGLYDGCLIKDNHVAAWTAAHPAATLAAALRHARSHIVPAAVLEVEVDSLEQLTDALTAAPDIVLLDNMPPDLLRRAVALRDSTDRTVKLEASGGVSLSTVAAIAATGVDRISVGALTHSAAGLDLGFDWLSG